MQLVGGDVLGTHLVKIALDQCPGLGDVLRIRAIGDGVAGAGLRCFHADVDVVDVSSYLAQIVVKAGGIEAATKYVIAQLYGVIVGIETVEVQLLGQRHRVLHRLGVGNVGSRGLV